MRNQTEAKQTQTATAGPAPCLPVEAPLQLETLESLASYVKARWQAVIHDSKQALAGSLAMGALIIMYAERQEIKTEVNKANGPRRGRKFTAYGFVARQLVEEYGDALPAEKQLRNCARAAEVARKKGLVEGSIGKLLGWGADKITQLIPEVKPQALRVPEDEEGREERFTSPVRLLLRRFAVIESAVQKATADMQDLPRTFRWSQYPKEETQWKKRLDSINSFLQHLDLELVDVKKKGRRK